MSHTQPGDLPRERKMGSLSTYGDIFKLFVPFGIAGLLTAVGMYWQLQSIKETQVADRALQTQTLMRIENRVERIDESVRGIENKVTSLDTDAKGTDRRLSHLERNR